MGLLSRARHLLRRMLGGGSNTDSRLAVRRNLSLRVSDHQEGVVVVRAGDSMSYQSSDASRKASMRSAVRGWIKPLTWFLSLQNASGGAPIDVGACGDAGPSIPPSRQQLCGAGFQADLHALAPRPAVFVLC